MLLPEKFDPNINEYIDELYDDDDDEEENIHKDEQSNSQKKKNVLFCNLIF